MIETFAAVFGGVGGVGALAVLAYVLVNKRGGQATDAPAPVIRVEAPPVDGLSKIVESNAINKIAEENVYSSIAMENAAQLIGGSNPDKVQRLLSQARQNATEALANTRNRSRVAMAESRNSANTAQQDSRNRTMIELNQTEANRDTATQEHPKKD